MATSSSSKLKVNLSRLSYESFTKLMRQLVPSNKMQIIVKYLDEEGDEISLTTEEDFQQAKEVASHSDNKVIIIAYEKATGKKVQFKRKAKNAETEETTPKPEIEKSKKKSMSTGNCQTPVCIAREEIEELFNKMADNIADSVAERTTPRVLEALNGAVLEVPRSEVHMLAPLVRQGSAVPETNTVHVNIFCNVCERQIVGVRYKCLNCVDFDLCSDCETLLPHNPDHVFAKIYRRVPISLNMEPLLKTCLYDMPEDRETAESPEPSSVPLVKCTPANPPPPQAAGDDCVRARREDSVSSAGSVGEFEFVVPLPDCFQLDEDSPTQIRACYTHEDIERIRERLDHILNSSVSDSGEILSPASSDSTETAESFVAVESEHKSLDEEEFVVAPENQKDDTDTEAEEVAETEDTEEVEEEASEQTAAGPEMSTAADDRPLGDNSQDNIEEERPTDDAASSAAAAASSAAASADAANMAMAVASNAYGLLQNVARKTYDVVQTLQAQGQYVPPRSDWTPPAADAPIRRPPGSSVLYTYTSTEAMQTLIEMGFGNRALNQRALDRSNGDVESAVEILIQEAHQSGDFRETV